jgi:hypothetical protein
MRTETVEPGSSSSDLAWVLNETQTWSESDWGKVPESCLPRME